MVKEVILLQCKCEKCLSIVDKTDAFCRVCGNELTKEVTFELKEKGNQFRRDISE